MVEPSRASPATATVVEPSARTLLAAAAFLLLGFGGQAVRNLVGWPGFVLVSLCLLVVAIRVLAAARPQLRALPPALIAFVAVCAVSVLWSEYGWTTAMGSAAQLATTAAGIAIAAALDRAQFMLVLARAMSAVVAASLVFELLVSTVIGHRFAPFFTERRPDLPGAFYWSENRLLEGGPIQGIVGNRNLLAFVALLAIIAVATTIAHRRRASAIDVLSLLAGVAALALTRSATVVVALGAVAAVAVLVQLSRCLPDDVRRHAARIGIGLLIIGAVLAIRHSGVVLGLLGRADLTNRVDVWRTVVSIGEQSPWLGIGWTGYWAPWAEPFDGLIVIDGVEYLQAHNALLDVWLQVGIAGVVAAICLIVGASRAAAGSALAAPPERAALAAGVLALLIALVTQSISESRLLIEGNWMLLTALVVQIQVSRPPRPAVVRWEPPRELLRAGRAPSDPDPRARLQA